MRIGVDSRPLREAQTSGIPMYVRSVLRALAREDRDNEYVLYAHRDFSFDLPPRWRKHVGGSMRYGSVWTQTELPGWLVRDRIDVYWGTEHVLPILLPRRIKTVLTVCDLVYVLHPETMSRHNRMLTQLLVPPSVRRADAIVTISQSTLDDLQAHFRPRTTLLRVAHLGVSDRFAPRDPGAVGPRVERPYPGLTPYILTVGTFEPRKNLQELVRAFASIAGRIPHNLAIAGQPGWNGSPALKAIERSGCRERIRLLGYVPDDALPDLYAGADAFAFPSLYEGFGLPPLEALASGVPVVCSNLPSLREVVGEAAMLVDPRDPDDIARGLLSLVLDRSLRTTLVARGLARAARFRWEKTAADIREVFSMVAESGRAGAGSAARTG